MDADQPLKTLFRLRARSLLRLIGEGGARILSTLVIELPTMKRSVDTVLRLRRGSETYLRHIEFEMRFRRNLALRLFEYAARLRTQLRLPVATTVVFLRPPAPRQLSYVERVRGVVVCQRSYDAVRLWDLDPRHLIALGPGPATLVGCAADSLPRHVRAAARLILRTTAKPECNDLLFVLQALCAGRYTHRQLARLIPREAVMASGMFAKEFRQARADGLAKGLVRGRVEGRIEGRVEAARETCLDIVRSCHPRTLPRVAHAIAACQSPRTLRNWAVAAARVPEADFVAVVSRWQRRQGTGVVHGRAPRPSRRSVRRSAR